MRALRLAARDCAFNSGGLTPSACKVWRTANGMDLPIDLVEPLYNPEHPTLALAADRYLRANDSQPARRARERLHPDERIISGSRFRASDSGDINYRIFKAAVVRELLELDTKNPPDEVFALFLDEYRSSAIVITTHGNTGVLYRIDSSTRYTTRKLSTSELARFKGFIKRNRINELPPLELLCDDIRKYEYAYLSPTNGTTVFISCAHYELERAPVYYRLLEQFYDVCHAGSFTLHYIGIDDLTDLEILRPCTNHKATAVWSEADDTRVLLEIDREISRWHSFTGGLGAVIDQPSACTMEKRDATWTDPYG